ncbi:hypothetical protein QJS10_CPB22g01344 [Acorus calamus]|uniref:Polygalacturonase n=1 Tax=Acorus calamus TaxID=4465 RepID=A0AAV9C1G7_ACOCL|nr:hypothetical protein QJS10_CPB22g01344 [Acorus calamus]
MKAWKKACSSSTPAIFTVPKNKNYLVKPVVFSGPCKSSITAKISGTIVAPKDRSIWGSNKYHWIRFDKVYNLKFQGGGTFNGNGHVWWSNSCKINKSALTFYKCNNLIVNDIRMINSQQMHLQFMDCDIVNASNLIISAPGNSPNTDGIHVAGTKNIIISNSIIQTGDDCISIVTGSKNVRAENINCGPGHGISIGSLGESNSEAEVSHVTVDNAVFTETMNGIRIKTWQGGRGYAKNIAFQNILMRNSDHPIIIDQNYCDSNKPCHQQKSAVAVSDVTYRNITGTSSAKFALNFNCSVGVPCLDVKLQDVNLVYTKGKAKTVFHNIKWSQKGKIYPNPLTP